MITTTNGFKVYNFKKVVSERSHVPYGFHVETWAIIDREYNAIILYTSDYLSQNSWTINHGDNEVLIEPYEDVSEIPWTKQLKTVIEKISVKITEDE